MILPLRAIFMSDELPTGDKAIAAFFEIVAIGYTCAAGDAILLHHDYEAGIKGLIIATVLFIVGIKWPAIPHSIVIKTNTSDVETSEYCHAIASAIRSGGWTVDLDTSDQQPVASQIGLATA